MEKNNSYKLEAIFYKRLDDVKFPSGGKKAEFVVELQSKGKNDMTYRDFVKFEMSEKWMDGIDKIDVGDKVEVEFSLAGREYTPQGSDEKKYFSSIKAWTIKILSKHNGDKAMKEVVDANSNFVFDKADDDSLPF